jgi:hypothetical protein
MEFSAGGSTSVTDYTYNDKNEVFWSQTKLAAGVLGMASTWYSGTKVIEVDVCLNDQYDWAIGAVAGKHDVESVVLHEIGHSLMLRDQYGGADASKVMYGYNMSGTTKRQLSIYDVAAARWIYGIREFEPPVTTVSGVPAGWSTTNVTVTLSAVDTGGSGVMFTRYRRVGAANWTTYGGPFQVTAEGTLGYEYYSMDYAGNVEATKQFTVRIDKTAPVTSALVSPVYEDEARINLQVAETGSGVAEVWYSLDGAPYQLASAPEYLVVEGDLGPHALSFYSKDVAGNTETPAPPVGFEVAETLPPVSTVDLEHNAGGVTFDRWVEGYSGAYSGGGYVYSRWEGVALQARFKGTKVRWMGPKQPSYGKANVYIDGSFAGTVDQYSASGTLESLIFESATLTDTEHTLEIRLTGAKNPASTGYVVVLDYFEVEGPSPETPYTRTDERAGSFTGSWVYGANPTYFASGYTYSRWANATYRYTFTGTRIAWVGPKTGDYGRADIYIDGPSGRAVSTTVSQYGSMGWRTQVWESPVLPRATYTITVRIRGDKVAASSGNIIVLDAWDVRP